MASTLELVIQARNSTDAAFKSLVNNIKEAEDAAKRSSHSFSDLQSKALSLAAGYLSLRGAVSIVVNALKSQSEAESAVNKLNLALANQGHFTEKTSKSLRAFADEIQRTTTFEGDAVVAAQAVLASFGMNEVQIKKTTLAAANLSAATGIELTAAVNLLGKAYAGNTGALSRYGIVIDESVPKAQKFEAALGQIEDRFSGSAQAATATFSGQMEQLKNALGDVSEGFGHFLNTLLKADDTVPHVLTTLQRLQKFFAQDMVTALSEFRARYLEMWAGIIESTAINSDKWRGFLHASFGGLLPQDIGKPRQEAVLMAAALRDQAAAIRQSGDEAAIAGGKFQTFTNQKVRHTAETEKLTAAAERAQAAWQKAFQKSREESDKFNAALEKAGRAALNDMEKDHKEYVEGLVERNQRALERQIDDQREAAEEYEQIQKELADAELKRQEQIRQGWIDTADKIAAGINALAGVFEVFGVSAESGIGKAIFAMQGLAQAGQDGARAFAAFASGDILGGITHSLNAIGGVANVFLGGQKEHMKVNDMRDQFIAAAGGLAALNAKAHEAGLTLDALLNAKKVEDFEAAVNQLTTAFDAAAAARAQALADEASAIDKTKAAMEEFGITIDQMGPKFAQQQLNEQALSLFEKYQLLTAAGADHNLVIEKMGPQMVEYVNQSRAAGVSIPEDMRKVVEELLAQGKILDENGVAFGTAEEAGITFGASLQDSMAKAAEQMERLVEAISRLFGIGEITIPVNFPVHGGLPSGPGGEHGPKFGQHGGMETGWGVPWILHGTPQAPEHIIPHDKLGTLLQQAIVAAGAQNGGGRPSYVTVGPITLDGAPLTRQVTRRIDMGWGRSKRAVR